MQATKIHLPTRKKVVFSLLVAAVAVVVIECAARWARDRYWLEWKGYAQWHSSVYPDKRLAWQIHLDALREIRFEAYPWLVFRHKPNQRLATLRVNKLGFRGAEVAVPKPPGVCRVLLLGGSVAWGFGATSDDTTIAGCLRRQLSKQSPGQRVEVVNAACPGHVTFQELMLYQAFAASLQPDWVVTVDGVNDFRDAMLTGRTLVSEPFVQVLPALEMALNRRAYGLRYGLNRMVQDCALLQAIQLAATTMRGHPPQPTHAEPSLVEETVRAWRDNLAGLAALARQRGARCCFALQPFISTGRKPLSSEEVQLKRRLELHFRDALTCYDRYFGLARAKLPALGAESGTVTCDLTDVFDGETGTIFTDSCHFGDRGNELVACRLAEMICKAAPSAQGARP